MDRRDSGAGQNGARCDQGAAQIGDGALLAGCVVESAKNGVQLPRRPMVPQGAQRVRLRHAARAVREGAWAVPSALRLLLARRALRSYPRPSAAAVGALDARVVVP